MLGLRRCSRDRRGLFASWCKGRALPCRYHRAGLHGCLTGAAVADAPSLPDSHGWRVMGPVSEVFRRQVSGLAQRQYGGHCAASGLAAEPVRALEDLLALCRRQGIPVRLLLMPEARAFRDLYMPTAGGPRRVAESVASSLGRGHRRCPRLGRGHGLLGWPSSPCGRRRRFTTRFGREALGPTLQEILAVRFLSYSPKRKKAVPQKVAEPAQAE